MTPYEYWFKRKPDVSNLRIWGCQAYVFVQKDKRRSLEPHMEKCVFVGYPSGYKGWKFYNPTTRKFIISERAEFDERVFPGLSTYKASSPVDLTPPGTLPLTPEPIPAPVFGPGGDNDDDDDDFIPSHSEPAPPVPAPAPVQPVPQPAAALPDPPVDLPPPERSPSPPPAPPADPLPPAPPNPIPAPAAPGRAAVRPITPPIDLRCTTRVSRQPGEWWKIKHPVEPPVEEPIIWSDEEPAAEDEHAKSATASEPRTFKQAVKGDHADYWREAATLGYNTLIENGTWEIVDLPEGEKAIGSGWVFKVKHNADGTIERFKARIVAKGYSQRSGIDYTESFAPTFCPATLRIIMALTAVEDLELRSVDITSAFTNGDLDEEIYMKQPEGFHIDKSASFPVTTTNQISTTSKTPSHRRNYPGTASKGNQRALNEPFASSARSGGPNRPPGRGEHPAHRPP